MTFKFHQNIRNLAAYRGISLGMNNGTATSVSIYSGVQPSAATITSNWASNGYNSNYLIHYPTGAIWTQQNGSTVGSGGMLLMTGIPAATVAANTGTATWAIIWGQVVASGTAAGQIGSSTLPAASFIVVPCSDTLGNGAIRFLTTTIASGTSYSISDSTINVGFTG